MFSHFTENAPMESKDNLKVTPGAPRPEDESINCVPQRGTQVKAATDPDALPHFEKNVSGKLSVDLSTHMWLGTQNLTPPQNK